MPPLPSPLAPILSALTLTTLYYIAHPPPQPTPSCESPSPLPLPPKPSKPGHVARNCMIANRRSIRARSLASKYTVNWSDTLGTGAYGSVHIAQSLDNNKLFAMKRMSKRYTSDGAFKREVTALLRIWDEGGCECVSGLKDMYEDEEYYYLVMDLVTGDEVFSHLINVGIWTESEARPLFANMASAVTFLHSIGIIHADLKPENFVLEGSGDVMVKLVDFGCASIVSDNRPLSSRPVSGTTAYWPPECFGIESREGGTEGSLDMWGLGVIFYIMLTGLHPFDLTGMATDDEIEIILRGSPVPPLDIPQAAHLSVDARDLILKLMNPDPMLRIKAAQIMEHPFMKSK